MSARTFGFGGGKEITRIRLRSRSGNKQRWLVIQDPVDVGRVLNVLVTKLRPGVEIINGVRY